MRHQLQQAAMNIIDRVAAANKQAAPDQAALQNCKIVAHRGEHDNISVIENTLQAFTNASTAGVWGFECDIRWSADLVPVIHHDASCERLFGDPVALASLAFSEIRERFPLIPSLAEVLSRFGGHQHLMLELKAGPYPEKARRKQVLQELLAPYSPGEDFHILMLDPALADEVDFLPRRYCILVAELNIARLSRAALAGDFGGLCGHYLLLGKAMQQRHKQAQQFTGTGFISSRNALFRELNRGMQWIFSNDAVRIQGYRDSSLASGPW